MLRFYIFIALLTLFLGCKKELDSNFLDSAAPVLPTVQQYNYTLQLVDSTLLTDTNSICFKTSVGSFYKDSLFYYSCKNKILVYNIITNKINKISLPLKFNGSITAIDVVGLDSLYILQSMPAKLFFIDAHTGSHNVTPLPKITFKTSNSFFNAGSAVIDYNSANYNLDYNNLKYDRVNNQVQIGVTPYDANILEGFERTNRIGVYDFKLNRWVKTFACPRGVYSVRGAYTFGNNSLSSKNILFKGDSTFIAYPVNHTVQLYVDKKFSKSINFTSKYSKNILKPLKLEEANQIEANKKLLNSTAYYRGVFYHEKKRIYSRIYLDEQKPFNDKGLYNTFLERDKYLIFLDENFNYVGEFKLLKNYNFLLATTDGFHIFTDNYRTRTYYEIVKK